MARALMDPPLLAALRYVPPTAAERVLADAALKARGRIVRHLPVRTKPLPTSAQPYIRSYPDGYRVEELGTFPRGCPVQVR